MQSELGKVREGINTNRAELAEKYSVKKIGVFGSVAKGISSKGSDIDFLVEFSEPIDLFRFSGLRLFLEDIFKKNVDLTTPKALKPMVRDEILHSVIYV